MPSGSKKRKASKKPKTGKAPTLQLGEPHELENEDSMDMDGEDTVDGSTSPKAMGDAPIEDGAELNGQASLGGDEFEELPTHAVDEVSLSDPSLQPELELKEVPTPALDEASLIDTSLQPEVEPEKASTPAPDEVSVIDASLQPEIEPEILIAEAADAADFEGEAAIDLAEKEAVPMIEEEGNTPSVEIETESDAAETNPELQKGNTQKVADASPNDTDVTESNQEVPIEVGAEPCKVQNDSGPGSDELPVEAEEAQNESEPGTNELTAEVEQTADIAKGDNDTTADTSPLDLETRDDDAPLEMSPTLEKAPADYQPDGDESTVARDLDTDAASAVIEAEGTDGSTLKTVVDSIEGPIDEARDEKQLEMYVVPEKLEMGATPLDDQPELAEPTGMEDLDSHMPAADTETATPAGVDPTAVDGSPAKTAPMEADEYDGSSQAEMDEAGELQTIENDSVKERAEEADEDGSVEESPQEVELAYPSKESQTADLELKVEREPEMDVVSAEAEPEADTTRREAELEIESSPFEIKPEADATLDEDGRDDMVQPKTEPEDEAAQANSIPEPDERDSTERDLDVNLENIYTALETEEDNSKGTSGELEVSEDTPVEIQGEAQPVTEGEVVNAEAAEDGTTELLEGANEDGFEGTETPLDANKELEAEPVYELETEPVVPPAEVTDSGVEESGLSATEADQVEAASIVDTEIPGIEQDAAEREVEEAISPSVKAQPSEEGAPADEGGVVESDKNAPTGEGNNSKVDIVEQHEAVVDDSFDEDKESLIEADRTVVPPEKDFSLKEEPMEKESATKLLEPALDNDEHSTLDPSVAEGEPEMKEQDLPATFSPQSEEPISKSEPEDGVAIEQDVNIDSPSGDTERDIDEDEAVSSTVAEAGSVLNDFDESTSYQLFAIDFSSEQDADIPESRDFDETSSSKGFEPFDAGTTEPTDGEDKQADTTSSQVDRNDQDGQGDDTTRLPVAVDDGQNDEVEWKTVQDFEGSNVKQEEGSPESTKADESETSLSAWVTMPEDVHVLEVCSGPGKEAVEEGEGGDENEQGAAAATFGIVPALEYLAVAEDELMSKVSPGEVDGHGLEAPTYSSGAAPPEETASQDNTAVMADESEIHTVKAKELNATTDIFPETELKNNNHQGMPLQSASPGRDIQDVQAFQQQNTKEASLPVVVPAQDVKQRALENVNLKGNERQFDRTTLQQRTNKGFDCCGLFDVLLRKNR